MANGEIKELPKKEEKPKTGFLRISKYICNTCNCHFESTAEPDEVKCSDPYCPTNGWKEPEPAVAAEAKEEAPKPAGKVKSWAARKSK